MKRTDEGVTTWTLSPDTVCRIVIAEIRRTDPDAAGLDLHGGIITTYAGGSITYAVGVDREVPIDTGGDS